eukprot:2701233-Pyramimonas_sp.AAC.1
MKLLGAAGSLQDKFELPLLAGGDFNMASKQLLYLDFLHRASLTLCVPQKFTYSTSKSKTTIDFFLLSATIKSQVEGIESATDYPLSPHRPVILSLKVKALEKVPVFVLPPQLPTRRPFGPAPESADWEDLDRLLDVTLDTIQTNQLPQKESHGLLDAVYGLFVKHFEHAVCLKTDTPTPKSSRRGQYPRVKFVPVQAVHKKARKSWASLVKPITWLQNFLQHLLRHLAAGPEVSRDFVDHGISEFSEAPQEYQSVQTLIAVHADTKALLTALATDVRAGSCGSTVPRDIFTKHYADIELILQEEKD